MSTCVYKFNRKSHFFPCPSTCAASVFCSKRCCHQHVRTHANLNSGQKSPPVSIVLLSIPASYKVLECACKFGTLVRSCMGMFWLSGVCSCSTGCNLGNKHSFIEKSLKGTSWACNTSNKAMQTCSTTSTCSDEEGG